MRVTVISIVLLICIILAAHGAPLDSRFPRAKALKIGSAKKAPLKAPKAKAATPVKIKTAKPVKAKAKPVKAKPAAKAKTTKVTSKAKATKPAAKKKTKAVANTKKAAPKAKSATVAKPTAVKVKSSTKAVKPKTAAIKPTAKTPAKTKATKAKTTKAPASKVGSTKATKAKASKTAVTKAKGANKTAAKAKTAATAKTNPAAKTKKPASAKACAIKKSKTVGKTTKKARVNTPPPADDGCEEVDICPEFDDCNTCVGVNAGCGFDFKINKCVKAAGSAINPLAKNKQQCTSFANSQAEASASSDDAIIKAAALKFFNPKIASHIFVGEKTSKRSGRHILSVWTKDNKDSTVSDNTNLGTTGIVRFAIPSSKKTKTVWNDVAGNGARVFSQAQIQDICTSALSASIKANSANKAALAGAGAADTGAASKSKKGKGKATTAPALKLLGGLDNAFVTPSPVGNLCVNVNEASCFPVSLKTVSGAIGSPCTGDDNEEGA